MIPCVLQIKNFLSYGPELITIDFRPYSLISLNGKNGHGKSALLDAITWSIWGQGRKTIGTPKADLGLVHLGQKQMLVILDFMVNNQKYRVRREYIKTKSKPYASLDFGTVKEDDTFTSLTDKTIKATQQKIETTIGISYDTFVNSTFLRQGHANEFSKKTPKERKDILADILQLNQFETLKQAAQTKARTLHTQVTTQQGIIQHLQKELSTLQAHAQEDKTVQEQYDATKKEITQYQSELTACEQKLESLQQQATSFERIEAQKIHISQQKEALTVKLAACSQRIKAALNHTHDTQKYEEIKKEYKKAQQKLQELQTKQAKDNELATQIQKITEQKNTAVYQKERAYTQAIHELKQQLIQKQSTAQHTQKEKAALQKLQEQQDKEIKELQAAYLQKQTFLKQHETVLATLEQQEQQLDADKATYHKALSTGTMLYNQHKDILQKKELITQNDETCCPLCEQNLSKSRKQFLAKKLHDQAEQLKQDIDTTKATCSEQKEALIRLHSQLTKHISTKEQALVFTAACKDIEQKQAKLTQERKNTQSAIDGLEKHLSKLKKEIYSLTKDIKDKEDLKKSISSKDQEILAYNTQLKAIHKEKEKNAYQQDEHHIINKKLKDLEATIEQTEQHMQTHAQLQHIQAQEKEYQEEIAHLEATLTSLARQLQPYEQIQQDTNNTLATKQTLVKKLQTTSQQLQSYAQQQGHIQARQAKTKELTASITSKEKELALYTQDLHDYQMIAKTLGKEGVQALLIEDALPEIEYEANLILGKLTDNQTHIFIESLKDLQKGGSKETLDIKISDAVGLRPYEMFSGGEAFRIDFSLRIAISKLLARRAGTALQTLIIDEGFGSQDEEGLNLIMDCIHKIHHDFAKVIIVSHLPSFKEQFPVQFLLHKTSTGTKISIFEQG